MRHILLGAIALLISCGEGSPPQAHKPTSPLRGFEQEAFRKVMILGTYHFAQENHYDELSSHCQKDIQSLNKLLAQFEPDKVFLERPPEQSEVLNVRYQKYLKDEITLDSLANEVYQIGFRLARQLGHSQIYLFDNQTEFIGSLQNFSFDSLDAIAEKYDAGFYDTHIPQMEQVWRYNDSLLRELSLLENLQLRNSPQMQTINAQRMHMYESRIGIGQNWMGTDWLARWYQRNLRMTGLVLRASQPNEKLLLIVGSNHKWIMEQIMHNTLDFEVVPSYLYLQNRSNP